MSLVLGLVLESLKASKGQDAKRFGQTVTTKHLNGRSQL